MSSLFVVSAIGRDKPGLVHSVAIVMSRLGVNIVDIHARSIRGHFLIFMVVDLSTSEYGYADMVEALEPVRENFRLGIVVEPYEAGRRKVDKNMMLLTIMGGDRPGIIAELSGLCADNNVNIESVKMIARGDYIASEFSVDTSDASCVNTFRKKLYDYSDKTGLNVSLRDFDIFQKPKRVVVFDCDSTIIQGEVIDELAEVAGVGDDVKKMTARAMNGEMDFREAIRARVSLLKGLTVKQLELLSRSIKLTPGTEELISALHFMGYKVAVISGGFTFFTNYLQKKLNIDYVFANELEIENGVTTGKITGEIIDAECKGELLEHIAEREDVSVDQIVAVGDGSNDRYMLNNAGLAIAFSPKEILKEYSDGMITHDNISGLLYFLGVPQTQREEIKKANGNS